MNTGPPSGIPDATDIADTTWLQDITVVQVIGAVVVLALIVYGIRRAIKAFRPVGEFLDDWRGEPARPGVTGRPGVMARFEHQDERLARIEEHISDAPTRREMTDVQQHLGRLDVQIAQVLPAPGVHHTVTTVTSDVTTPAPTPEPE